ncbi:MAG: cytochrome c biogenesis protein [Planctomycetota bacterium]|jgi:cytochrome c-type biogenesis protein CcsB
MAEIEVILFWITIFTYVAAFCSQIFFSVSGRANKVIFAMRILWLAFAFHTATGIARWIAAGHPPVTDSYEFNLTGMWFTMLVFIAFERFKKADPIIALVVTPLVFLGLGHGQMSRIEVAPMGPAYQSPWLIVHVIFAWFAFGCYAVATGAGIVLLLRNKLLARKPDLKIPSPEALDISNYRFVVLGFINHTIMLVSGAIWAKKLWGHYWSWDALETWSLIAFLFYAFYLHARSFLGWKMKKAAWLAVLGIIILAISFWGIEWFAPSVHPGPWAE